MHMINRKIWSSEVHQQHPEVKWLKNRALLFLENGIKSHYTQFVTWYGMLCFLRKTKAVLKAKKPWLCFRVFSFKKNYVLLHMVTVLCRQVLVNAALARKLRVNCVSWVFLGGFILGPTPRSFVLCYKSGWGPDLGGPWSFLVAALLIWLPLVYFGQTICCHYRSLNSQYWGWSSP